MYSVVVPYYLSQGYNELQAKYECAEVVVPYYLSQGYNTKTDHPQKDDVVVPYYLSQGYNEFHSLFEAAGCSSLLSLSRV